MDKLNDHQECFFFNRLITDFEPRALRLSDSWRMLRARSKHESAWYLKLKKLVIKVILNRVSWVSRRSNRIGVEERHQLKILLAALWRISNWLVRHFNLLLFLVTHSTRFCFLCWSYPLEFVTVVLLLRHSTRNLLPWHIL